METEEIYQCECLSCGRTFDSSKIVEKKYQEYAGASYQSCFVSPCCHSEYEEKD